MLSKGLLVKLTHNVLICTISGMGIYPNNRHGEISRYDGPKVDLVRKRTKISNDVGRMKPLQPEVEGREEEETEEVEVEEEEEEGDPLAT
uniref:Uncharacterized protein n=1 Tax=Vespula pensylvanica TaxID=30213 RepID=A0A834PCN5_VESPE|nr:hypothetical protein H0235_003882 [Vespula pensylvanica]